MGQTLCLQHGKFHSKLFWRDFVPTGCWSPAATFALGGRTASQNHRLIKSLTSSHIPDYGRLQTRDPLQHLCPRGVPLCTDAGLYHRTYLGRWKGGGRIGACLLRTRSWNSAPSRTSLSHAERRRGSNPTCPGDGGANRPPCAFRPSGDPRIEPRPHHTEQVGHAAARGQPAERERDRTVGVSRQGVSRWLLTLQ